MNYCSFSWELSEVSVQHMTTNAESTQYTTINTKKPEQWGRMMWKTLFSTMCPKVKGFSNWKKICEWMDRGQRCQLCMCTTTILLHYVIIVLYFLGLGRYIKSCRQKDSSQFSKRSKSKELQIRVKTESEFNSV